MSTHTEFSRRVMTGDRIVFNLLGYTLLIVFAFLCAVPFYLVIIASFTSEASIMRNGFQFYITEFSLGGYELILNNPLTIMTAYRNTILVTALGTVIAVFFATITGYALSRPDFPWRNGFSFYFFFTTLFSGGLTPWYMLCTRYLGFKNQYYALVLPLLFSVWNMIIAKNYMKSLPHEITESAKIDGANDFTIYMRLILPLCTPLVATLGLFTALAFWNDWYNCMLFISKPQMYTLQYFLQEMLNSAEALKRVAEQSGLVSPVLPTESMRMAMTIIVTGPILLAYPFAQKYFVKGLTIGAVKG